MLSGSLAMGAAPDSSTVNILPTMFGTGCKMRLASLEAVICMLAMMGKSIANMTLTDRIKVLKVGRSFNVKTESERTQALNVANILGRRIITLARKRGGFTVTRLPS